MLKQITKGATRNILHFYINQKKAKNIKKNKEKTRLSWNQNPSLNEFIPNQVYNYKHQASFA